MECVIPDSALRGRFSDAVTPLLDRVAANLRESRTLSTIRDTLLPKLLSGEIRVKEAEKLVGEVA
jgi:type I restriction enzyme S subunit